MNLGKSLILQQVMSPASVLIIYLTDHFTGKYSKSLKQSKEEKMIKTTKIVKTVIKAKKLENIKKISSF